MEETGSTKSLKELSEKAKKLGKTIIIVGMGEMLDSCTRKLVNEEKVIVVGINDLTEEDQEKLDNLSPTPTKPFIIKTPPIMDPIDYIHIERELNKKPFYQTVKRRGKNKGYRK